MHENDTDRALWAAELALAADVLATASSFAIVCISDSLQCLAAFSQTPLAASAGTGHKLEFLSACEGLIPQTLIDRIARLTSAGIITKGEAEDIACTFVLDERLRPRPWREPREPEQKEVERAVEVARLLTKRVRAIRRPPLSAQSG